eukprot:6189248-Pleurochrysis_carterae.AAC.2
MRWGSPRSGPGPLRRSQPRSASPARASPRRSTPACPRLLLTAVPGLAVQKSDRPPPPAAQRVVRADSVVFHLLVATPPSDRQGHGPVSRRRVLGGYHVHQHPALAGPCSSPSARATPPTPTSGRARSRTLVLAGILSYLPVEAGCAPGAQPPSLCDSAPCLHVRPRPLPLGSVRRGKPCSAYACPPVGRPDAYVSTPARVGPPVSPGQCRTRPSLSAAAVSPRRSRRWCPRVLCRPGGSGGAIRTA